MKPTTPEEIARSNALLSAIWRTAAEQLSSERVRIVMEEILEERRERVRQHRLAMNVPVNVEILKVKIKALGGAERLAIKLGVSRSGVYRWIYQRRMPGWALTKINEIISTRKATS